MLSTVVSKKAIEEAVPMDFLENVPQSSKQFFH